MIVRIRLRSSLARVVPAPLLNLELPDGAIVDDLYLTCDPASVVSQRAPHGAGRRWSSAACSVVEPRCDELLRARIFALDRELGYLACEAAA